VPSCLGTPRS